MKWLLFGGLLLAIPLLAVDCNKIWKSCYAHCSVDKDPSRCYDQCMSFYGCRK